MRTTSLLFFVLSASLLAGSAEAGFAGVGGLLPSCARLTASHADTELSALFAFARLRTLLAFT